MSNTDDEIDDLSVDYEYEYEIEEEGESEEYEERSIYDSDDFISGAYLSTKCTLPENMLEFDHSFSYDCKRLFNLVAIEENILIFASGNLINFYDIQEKKIWFRRSAFGRGIGHITKNPNELYPHLAVAENGKSPPIIIYEWPTLNIVCLLKGGALERYVHVSYSPEGDLLSSQAGEPDFLITIWNWRKHTIMLRTKSYVNDVYNCMFSPTVPGQLTSSGAGHIKFWKMAQTFTGLKLQGELGRFGKTEICDIIGVYPMPDEKVVSGCDWGNILVWDEGLITKEVTRRLKKRCHGAPVTQFIYNNGELTSIGLDGWIRTWYFDSIDTANPPEDARFVEAEPIYEYQIGETKTTKTELMSIDKQKRDPNDTMWFAQDGNGGILLIDLSTEIERLPSERIYLCHAGAIIGIASSPWSTHLASLGVDGRLHLYNYMTKELLLIKQFPASGSALLWLPISVDKSGSVIIMAFGDGVVRVVVLSIKELQQNPKLAAKTVTLIQKTKPHNKPINCMSMNLNCSILATTAEDCTLFVHQITRGTEFIELIPIGYIQLPAIATCLTWKPNQNTVILVGCLYGQFVEAELPEEPVFYTDISYLLHSVKIKENCFVSQKALIRRELKLAEIAARKYKKLQIKKDKLAKMRADNPGLEFDEETFLADSESEEELDPLHIPEVPNRILFTMYTPEDTIWLSLSGYDAGYIYEYKIDETEPIKSTMVCDEDDMEIHSFLFDHENRHLFLGMADGRIRINKVCKEDFRNLSDYWYLAMHDTYNGSIPMMCFNYDQRYFFSCGSDGNIFSYLYLPPDEMYITKHPKPKILSGFPKCPVEDTEELEEYLSLEEDKTQAEYNRKMKVANQRKKKVESDLAGMVNTFRDLMQRNRELLPSQVIPHEEFELDCRITEDLRSTLQADLDLVNRKLAFEVEKSRLGLQKLMDYFIEPLDVFPFEVYTIDNKFRVKAFKQRKLGKDYQEARTILEIKIEEEEARRRAGIRHREIEPPPPPPEKKVPPLESFLIGLSESFMEKKFTPKIKRLLRKYRARKQKLDDRQMEWDELYSRQPKEGVNHPDDEAALKLAMQTIGDFKLKSAPNYKVPKELRETLVKKYEQLLDTREKACTLRQEFNKKVLKLREDKCKLINHIIELTNTLIDVQTEIPTDVIKSYPPIPTINDELEFPEKHLEVEIVIPSTFNKRLSRLPIPVLKLPLKVVMSYDIEKAMLSSADDIVIINEKLMKQEYRQLFEIPIDVFKQSCLDDESDSEWAIELKSMRLTRKIYEQTEIISAMETSIQKFNDNVKQLYDERLMVHRKAVILDNFITTVHQELLILKEFEGKENDLTDKVLEKLDEKHDMLAKISSFNIKIENKKRDIESFETKALEIQKQFLNAATENKFYDYLRKIFKKKYKPPKIRSEDDDESSESSSESSEDSEEDEGAESVDSRDLGIMRLDETVCPKGCDQTLFDLTFTLRGQRHILEQNVKEEQKNIELIKKEIDTYNKKLKVIEVNLKRSQEELEEYQREKQRRLNEVECLVVLKLSQVRNLTPEGSITPSKDSLLFLTTTLKELYARVGELKNETFAQRAKHRLNKLHLQRMETDIKYMEGRIIDLKRDVNEAMCRKFGKVISLDELEEAILRRLVHDLRVSLVDVKSEYDKELNYWTTKYREKKEHLARVIQDNTDRLNLLTILEEEKNKLRHMLKHQSEKIGCLESDLDKMNAIDIERLMRISKSQSLQIQALKEEIHLLSVKPGSGPPPRPQTFEPEVMPPEEEIGTVDLEQPPSREPEAGDSETIINRRINSLICELVKLIKTVNPQRSEIIVHHAMDEILGKMPSITPNCIDEVVDEIVDNIADKLPEDAAAQNRDHIHGYVNEIVQELTSIPIMEQNDTEDNEVPDVNIEDTTKDIVREVIMESIAQLPMKNVNSLEQCIEIIITNLLDQLPVEYITQKSSISAIVEQINETVELDPGSPTPVIKVDEMIDNIMSTQSLPGNEEHVRQIISEIMDKFLTGELLPENDPEQKE